MSLSLGESLRTRFPGIPPNVLSPSLFPYGCRIALAESQRILQETDIRQTLDLPTTTHRHGCVLILWVKNCTMAPQDFVQSLDCIIWSSEPRTLVGLPFLHLSSSLGKQGPDSVPCIIFSVWQACREGKEIESIEKE